MVSVEGSKPSAEVDALNGLLKLLRALFPQI